MAKRRRIVLWIIVSSLFLLCGRKQQGISQFVRVENGKLYEGKKELRFISFNVPNLHYIEDNLPFAETNPWRLPDEFEIRDALRSVQQMGGQVVRIYALSVKGERDGENIPRHVLGPNQFHEEAFRTLDLVLKIAREYGIRLIIPFVDNWSWWGGVAEYAAFRGKPKEAFWHDPQIIADFKSTLAYVLNRTNSFTGISYKDDPMVLAWETGNELTCPPEWTAEIAAFIKSIDRNHLVMDGFHSQKLRESSLADPNVDIVTTHHYE
ncbi:MAG: cellulase family glycosylhydrolase, partial [candidate division KSB1 bacterium]|nr:cellulase family glycosylhydrolase [candidate division KSB1 bacterium]